MVFFEGIRILWNETVLVDNLVILSQMVHMRVCSEHVSPSSLYTVVYASPQQLNMKDL